MLSTTLILTALATLSVDVLAAPIQPPVVSRTMPLRRNPHSIRTTSNVEAWAMRNRQHLSVKYGAATNATNERRASGEAQITNQNADSSFFGTVAVGTPPVAYSVILDTGSSDFWLADSSCTNCPTGASTFQTTTSSSYVNLNQPFSIQYGSGASSGMLGTETVQMNGFSVAKQVLGLCNVVSKGLLQNPVSGLMGLAFRTISSSGAMPFWQVLATGNVWDSPVMSFHLTRYDNDASAASLENGGSFTMGALDTSLYTGQIQYTNIPNNQQTYWVLPMTGITAHGTYMSIPSGPQQFAAIDTGTTLIGGPPAAIAQIYSNIPGAVRGSGGLEGYWTYPCGTKVSAALSFGGGQAWPISDADFQLKQVAPGTCLGAFFELPTGNGAPAWIVGDTFLKNVYSVFRFNPPSVGFAQLSASALAQNGQKSVAPSATIPNNIAVVTATADQMRTGQQSGNSASNPVDGIIHSIFGNAAGRSASASSVGLLVTMVVAASVSGVF